MPLGTLCTKNNIICFQTPQPMLPTRYSSVLPISRIDLTPADTTATGVRPSSVKSALTSRAVKGQAALCWWLCCTPNWRDLTSQKATYAWDATAWLHNCLDPQANIKGLDRAFRCWDWKRYWQKEVTWLRAEVQPCTLISWLFDHIDKEHAKIW